MISYSYDETGFRTRKGMTGTQTWFDRDAAGNLVHETRNNGKDHLYYYYDARDSIGSISYNGVRYAFRKNLQGDVIAILDTSGNVVARYTYDAWGKVLSVTDANGNANTSSTFIGNVNPIRYRGYYYDTETRWYYLNSRYYDPTVKRFINADSQTDTSLGGVGYNLFVYCGNNPVTYSDMEGTSAAAALAIAGGSSLVPGFGWVIGGIILVGVAVVAGVAAGEATRNNIQDAPKSSLKTKTLADVKAKIPRQPVYQLAYISIYDNLVRLPKYYTFYQILILLDVYRLDNLHMPVYMIPKSHLICRDN